MILGDGWPDRELHYNNNTSWAKREKKTFQIQVHFQNKSVFFFPMGKKTPNKLASSVWSASKLLVSSTAANIYRCPITTTKKIQQAISITSSSDVRTVVKTQSMCCSKSAGVVQCMWFWGAEVIEFFHQMCFKCGLLLFLNPKRWKHFAPWRKSHWKSEKIMWTQTNNNSSNCCGSKDNL